MVIEIENRWSLQKFTDVKRKDGGFVFHVDVVAVMLPSIDICIIIDRSYCPRMQRHFYPWFAWFFAAANVVNKADGMGQWAIYFIRDVYASFIENLAQALHWLMAAAWPKFAKF